jgi:NAD(P)-dependent dehydrogenase (short-subunit alcohol dehydrogenase family)
MTDLQDKVAFVTGGTRGIGLAIAQALVEAGMRVAISGRSQAGVNAALKTLGAAGSDRAAGFSADVRRFADVEHAIAATVERFGGLDVLVNNAGIGVFRNVAEMTVEEWSEVIDTNLTGAFFGSRAAIPHLRRRGGGFIVNISSLAGKNAFKGGAAYCASKSGLNAFSEALMQEVRYDGIRVSYVMPGSVATGFSSADGTEGADWKIPPGDVAEVVLNLLRQHPRSLASRVELRPSKPQK